LIVPQLTLLLIGDVDRPDFREAVAAMHAACRVLRFPTIASSVDSLDGHEQPPDVIVLAQGRPGEYPADDLQRLRRWAALAPVVALLGPWSEGEMRSGEPLPGVVRVYWHQWLPRFERQMAMFARGICPAWGLPPTSTDEERLLWSNRHSRAKYEGVIAIVAERREMADWLADACASLGLTTVRMVPCPQADPRDIAAVLWDTFSVDDDAIDLTALKETFVDVPIVAVTGFLRTDQRQRLLAAGAAAVLSKPLLLEDLEWQLEKVLAPQSG
jgi:CheY-like chemotaxis protein